MVHAIVISILCYPLGYSYKVPHTNLINLFPDEFDLCCQEYSADVYHGVGFLRHMILLILSWIWFGLVKVTNESFLGGISIQHTFFWCWLCWYRYWLRYSYPVTTCVWYDLVSITTGNAIVQNHFILSMMWLVTYGVSIKGNYWSFSRRVSAIIIAQRYRKYRSGYTLYRSVYDRFQRHRRVRSLRAVDYHVTSDVHSYDDGHTGIVFVTVLLWEQHNTIYIFCFRYQIVLIRPTFTWLTASILLGIRIMHQIFFGSYGYGW